MAKYFVPVFTQKPLLDEEISPKTKSISRLLTVDDVIKALSFSGTEMYTGLYEIRPKVLRQIVQYIAVPLITIFNMSSD